jgi:4-carboxymuconolactone decarboxylase
MGAAEPSNTPAPRLPPVPVDTTDDAARAGFAAVGSFASAANPVLGTLMWHPELTTRYMPFSDYVKNGGLLPLEQRRLLILRTAWNCGADYQWVAHAGYAREMGVADDVLARIALGASAEGWSPLEGALLRAADELHADRCVGHSTWNVLRGLLTHGELVEVVMLVGNYEMIGMLMNTMRILPSRPAPAYPGNRFLAPEGAD